MRNARGWVPLGLAISLMVTACGGGTSTGSRSYVAGNGAVTFINASQRKAAPPISGATLDGGNFRLETNHMAVINVWASWCAPCRAESPTLADLSRAYPKVNFVGVLTRDTLASARAFVRRFRVPYPSLIDDSILMGFQNSLMANAIPTTVVIDKNGRVAARISGQITVASLSQVLDKVSAE